MAALILLFVIVVLVVVHEFGHFIAAKLSGMRVDEFGIGYPPRAATLGTIGDTTYSLNWVPFGGFVKIYGEDDSARTTPRSFASKNRFLQAIVLIAGVTMNVLLAYVLITAGLIVGTPRALDPEEVAGATQVQLIVANVLSDSPAASAGLISGDVIVSAVSSHDAWNPSVSPSTEAPTPESFTGFIGSRGGETLKLSIRRGEADLSLTATPVRGIVETDPGRYALGIEVATIGVIPVAFSEAFTEGALITAEIVRLTAVGLWQFFSSVFTLTANLGQVSGPVGIAGAVGTASAEGLGTLLSLVAIISINLAIINLIPVPALDGGRLLFVLIESVIRRPINPRVAQTLNSLGFVFLILLMLVVTAHDIFNIVA